MKIELGQLVLSAKVKRWRYRQLVGIIIKEYTYSDRGSAFWQRDQRSYLVEWSNGEQWEYSQVEAETALFRFNNYRRKLDMNN